MPATESRVLVVEDDPDTLALLRDILSDSDFQVELASDLETALRGRAFLGVDAIVTDFELPDGTGLDLCAAVQQHDSELPVIVLTSHARLAVAVEALRAGAFDFLTKPISQPEILVRAVQRACESRRLRTEVRRLRDQQDEALDGSFPGIVGSSREMREALGLLRRVAPFETNVLVSGETGTGKELVARALHGASPRAAGPFVAINCAAIPTELLESELFGHKAGAYTGAEDARRGLFLAADGGTLFLDEIGDMPPDLQAKLLRVLQDREIRPVGSDETLPVDVRIVSATHQNLRREVTQGGFREDLYFRLNVVEIRLPPLRRRGADVLTLAKRFLDECAEKMGAPVPELSPEASARLLSYSWPGNVRELQNGMERALIVGNGERVELHDLAEDILGPASDDLDERGPVPPDELETLEQLEARHIARVMAATNGNKLRAAQVLGVDRTTLYRKLKRYDLRRAELDAPA